MGQKLSGLISLSAILLYLLAPATVRAQGWTTIAALIIPRSEPEAVVLRSGLILIAGGRNQTSAIASCELYNPVTNTWKPTGSLIQGRFRGDLKLLPDGRVIYIGGLADNNVETLSSMEIYDPTVGTWSVFGNMDDRRENFPSAFTSDSTLIFMGGLDANSVSYLSSGGAIARDLSYKAFPNMLIGTFSHFMRYSIILNSLVKGGGNLGGFSGFYMRSTELGDLNTGKWSLTDSLDEPAADGNKHVVQLEDDNIIIPSGRSGASSLTTRVQEYDVRTKDWRTIGNLIRPHFHSDSHLIGQDSILTIGGITDPGNPGSTVPYCTWYYLKDNTSKLGPALPTPLHQYASVKFSEDDVENPCQHQLSIYVFGGTLADGTPTAACERLDLGLKPSPAVLSLSPAVLSLAAPDCLPFIDTAVTLTVKACKEIRLDSVVAIGSDFSASSLMTLPSPVAADGVIRIPIRIRPTANVSSAVMLVFETPVGRQVKYVHIDLQRSVGNPTALGLPKSLTLTGSECDGAASTFDVSNLTCDVITIDSLHTDLLLSLRTTEDEQIAAGKVTLDPSKRHSFSVQIENAAAGSYTGKLRIYYHNASGTHDTTITISLVIDKTNTPSAQLFVKDVTNAFAGDTISVPVSLLIAAPQSVEGVKLRISYNRNLLDMLPPDYKGTLAEGTAFEDINELPDGAEIVVPTTLALESGKNLFTLRFRCFLSDTNCTTLRLQSALFSPFAKSLNCVLQSNLDSARICVQPACGDAEILQVLKSRHLALRSIISNSPGILTIAISSPRGSATIEVFNILGNRVAAKTSSQRQEHLKIIGAKSGSFIVRISDGVEVVSSKVVVNQ